MLIGYIFRGTRVVVSPSSGTEKSWIDEVHPMPDHVHVMISIPSKYAFSQFIGYIKRAREQSIWGRNMENFRGILRASILWRAVISYERMVDVGH